MRYKNLTRKMQVINLNSRRAIYVPAGSSEAITAEEAKSIEVQCKLDPRLKLGALEVEEQSVQPTLDLSGSNTGGGDPAGTSNNNRKNKKSSKEEK